MDKPEFGKLYALTGGSNDKCIMNGNTWAESEVKGVPRAVRNSAFGCRNCLWAGVECKNGMKYEANGTSSCKNYTYYD